MSADQARISRHWRRAAGRRQAAKTHLERSLARTQTALVHVDFAALCRAGDLDIDALARILQGLRDTARRLRGEAAQKPLKRDHLLNRQSGPS